MTLFSSIFKLNKYSRSCNKVTRYLSSNVTKEIVFDKKLGDPSYIQVLSSWKPNEEQKLRTEVLKHMQVIPQFVNEAEEVSLLAEVEPQLKRMRYEFDHWDNVIEGYRETERTSWNLQNSDVIARIKSIFKPGTELLPHAHILDLAVAGYIRPHVDAVRFCGDMIAGLCLLSSAVMRLVHQEHPNLTVDALLERRSLYIMRGVARYQFSHAVLGGEESVWKGEKLPRKRRVAIICRERPKPEDTV